MIEYICCFEHHKHGESGNELPPPRIGGNIYTVLAFDDETEKEFRDRMCIIGRKLRDHVESIPAKPYSWQDGWSWLIRKVSDPFEAHPELTNV